MDPKKEKLLNQLKNGLIVSCQSEPPEPFARPSLLLAMARAAIMGGAVGIRSNLPQNIRFLKKHLAIPLIGIYKKQYPQSDVLITPTLKELKALLKTGVPVIALDATLRKRPAKEQLKDLVSYARTHFDGLLMADISTVEEGVKAAELGFDLIATTLAGYTHYTTSRLKPEEPDFTLIKQLVKEMGTQIPIVAEGRIWHPEQAKKCLELGAFAVVVGSAITRPWLITERFIQAMKTAYSF